MNPQCAVFFPFLFLFSSLFGVENEVLLEANYATEEILGLVDETEEFIPAEEFIQEEPFDEQIAEETFELIDADEESIAAEEPAQEEPFDEQIAEETFELIDADEESIAAEEPAQEEPFDEVVAEDIFEFVDENAEPVAIEDPAPDWVNDSFAEQTVEYSDEEEEEIASEDDFYDEFCQPVAEECLPKERQIRSIVLLGECCEILSPEALESVPDLETCDIVLPTSLKSLQELLDPLYYEPLNNSTLQELKKALYCYFQTNGEPFVLVLIPNQVVSSRVIQIRVIRAKLGDVFVEGTDVDADKYKKEIWTAKGDEIYPALLEEDLAWINRDPFRRADLIYQAGKEPATTDLILAIRERRPWRVYVGTDNTGVRTISRERVMAGASFGMPHGFFTCQYTASYDFSKFQAITGQYIAYFPWRHLLNLYGGYSTVHASLPIPTQRTHGESSQGSLRYTIPLRPVASMNHEISFGGDFKSTNNTLEFSELYTRYSQQVNLTQLAFSYEGSWQKNRSRIDFEALVFWSPGPWLPDQTDADYNSLRPGARNEWVYGRAGFRYIQKTSQDFSTELGLRFQITGQNLIPSEQLGIGGYDTVRGYDERQLNMDEGLIANFELRTPPIALISKIRDMKVKDSIQFLGFLDYGIGGNHKLIPGEVSPSYLLGIGPGLRYTLDPWIAFRIDLGFKLHTEPSYTGGPAMLHFGLTGSY